MFQVFACRADAAGVFGAPELVYTQPLDGSTTPDQGAVIDSGIFHDGAQRFLVLLLGPAAGATESGALAFFGPLGGGGPPQMVSRLSLPASLAPNGFANGSASMALADFDGDGRDEVLLRILDQGGVTIGFSPLIATDGATSVSVVGEIAIPEASLFGDVVDFDRDGNLDLVAYIGGHDVTSGGGFVAPGLGNGELGSPRIAVFADHVSVFTASTVFGDFFNDGAAHPFTRTKFFTQSGFRFLTQTSFDLARNRDGIFDVPETVTTTPGDIDFRIAVTDADLDGNADVWVVGQGTIQLFRGHGDGTFTPGPIQDLRVGQLVAVADVDGDGIDDLVFWLGRAMWTLYGDGRGGFRHAADR